MHEDPKDHVDSHAETVGARGASDVGAGKQVSPGFERGVVVGGRYRVDAFLAAGGMGHVYRAYDLDLDVPIALKTIRPEIASNPASLRRFKQEVLLARSVTHSNVCRIFDLQRDDATGVSFLTMEFLPGETLSSRIEVSGALSADVALPLIRQMAEALDTAHRAGVVHRDFKSANVMLVPDDQADRAVITDFGLAVTLSAGTSRHALGPGSTSAPSEPSGRATVADAGVTEIGVVVGTPAYMSPEQVRGDAVGPASDLYALGVVLFEMCTGRLPFRGATPIETARAQLTAEPPRPRAVADIDDTWDRAILRLLSKNPSDRFATARDVVHALEGRFDETIPTPYHLPAEHDTFVGRAAELETIASMLKGSANRSPTRLLTLQGPGGTGKTRLALRYGWEKTMEWPGGIWFCDVSEARTPDGIAAAVARALGVSLGKDDPVVQLGHAMAARRECLLILDNFEQVAEHARATLGRWIERATEASFMVTSRERLHLPQETVLDLAPLDPASEGVELFEVRARAYRAGFMIDGTNRAQVEAIVRHLDGLPLAIELAASRLRMLNLEQLGARLQDRFKVLAGGKRGRHATLRATLDWSWELLEPWERSAMAQVSVFEGGFTLEAAEAVVDLSSFDEDPLVLDVIQSLVDKSWLRAKVVWGAPRFEMYVTVQEYANEKLLSASLDDDDASLRRASLAAAESRHGAHYAELGSMATIESLDRHGGVERRATLDLELDNLVAACRRAIGRRDEALAVATFAAANHVFQLRGPFAVSIGLGREVVDAVRDPVLRGRALMDLAVAERLGARTEDAREHFEAARGIFVTTGDRRSEGIAHTQLGILLGHLGRMAEAREHYEAAVAIHRELGDRRHLGSALGNLGILHWHQGRTAEAQEHYEMSLDIHREVGNRGSEGIILGNLGSLFMGQGRMAEAREHYEAALVILREVGNRWMEAMVLANMGGIDHEQGRLSEARKRFETALAINREIGHRSDVGVVLGYLGGLHQEEQRIEEARECLEKALAIHREVGNRRFEGFVLSDLGELDRVQGLTAEARTHAEAALAIHRELGNRRGQGITLRHLGEIAREQGRIDEARGRFEESLIILRDVGDRLEMALTSCSVGEMEAQHDLAAARTALAEAEALAKELAVEPSSALARKIDRVRQALARG